MNRPAAYGPRFETICVHHGEQRERNLGAAAPPLYQNSTFTYPNAAEFEIRERPDAPRFDYTRTANPTTQLLEEKLAVLEGGERARAFASGMGAISAAILSCVKAGDHVVCIDTVYGPTRSFLASYLPRFQIETTFVAGTSVSDFEDATRPNTRLFYVESPSSLVYAIQDLTAVAELARRSGIRTICDNSYCTPYLQQPLTMGIDLVVHTATKYLGGHSDLVAGIVVGSKALVDPLIENEGKLLGSVLDPFASWLMLRGLRTLAIRLDRHSASALAIAHWLERHPRVARVFHPGLDSHVGCALARRQMRGTSGLLTFVLKDATRESTQRVVDALRYFCIAVSWGGYESLAIPIRMRLPGDPREQWAIRLSVGLEHVDDLLADLESALAGSAGLQGS